ncbi:MAG: hypothetical protein A3I61_16200 [Acidobacteria bacterium RIFCSPLOWO2_02_FULL_68_18]|nr:MAG: hypothetical protein A3I61_16200 [Acidobacteria bacterium RIFCSPLOWO2_02_FULL_68_18]OFW48972.1 MAG: hypothetical protein A3G77_05280 [Acidobacteria bacterium RIFCSPLOWO2_12_FULL_68_19]
MNRFLMLALGAALAASACGTTASDATDAPLNSGSGVAAEAPAPGPAARAPAPPRTAAEAAVPAGPVYREVTIPAGTTLPLALTSAIGSDTSAVEDAVTAELARPVMIDGREVLPAGARLAGTVTEVDGSGRVKGRAMIAFRFTSLRTGDEQYELQAAPLTHVAPATKGEDAAKIGIGAGAGAIIGGVLGGGDGAAKGAVIGGGAGTGVVLATKGQEVRLGPGADVSAQLTAPLTVRVRTS